MANNIIEIIAKFINEASKGLQDVKKDVGDVDESQKSTKKSSDDLTESFLKNALAGVTVGAVFTSIATGVKATIDAYGEAEVVGAQVNAVLQSTGGIAGVTAEEVDNLANRLSSMSGVDDEVIAKGEAVLLTFTKVGKDVFPAATEAALNMSAAMGTDLQSSIMQVGKALNEPIQGAAALRRVGVQLTDQQEEQIKAFMEMNDVASAQKIILAELETEFGGVARMMGDTTVGSANKLKVAWGNLLETIGEGNAKTYREANEGLTTLIETNTTAFRVQNLGNEAVEKGLITQGEYTQMVNSTISSTKTMADVERELTVLMYDGADSATVSYTAWAKYAESISGVSAATEEYIPKFGDLLNLSARISNETQTYNEKQADVITKQGEIQAKIDELIAQGWSPMSQKVQDLQRDYDNLGVKSDELAQKHSEAMGKMQYDLLLTKLSADGLDEADFNLMQQAGLMFGVFNQESVNSARNMDLVAQAVSAGTLKVKDMQAALNMLNKGYSIDIVMNIIQSNSGSLGTFKTGHDAKTPYGGGYAEGTGGYKTVPSGYPNDSYMIGLTSGERFNVVPPGDDMRDGWAGGGMGGGGSTYINLTIASPITIMDEQSVKSVLLPFIIDGINQAKSVGAIPL